MIIHIIHFITNKSQIIIPFLSIKFIDIMRCILIKKIFEHIIDDKDLQSSIQLLH